MPSSAVDLKWFHYFYSCFCGFFGSMASLSSTLALDAVNKFVLYRWIYRFQNYPDVCCYTMRGIFGVLMVVFNIKMVEFKIKSFAKIGASFTVINAFFTGFIFNTCEDIIILQIWPTRWEYIGSFCIFGGIIFIQQDEINNNARRAKLKQEEAKLKEAEKILENSTVSQREASAVKEQLNEKLIDDAINNENIINDEERNQNLITKPILKKQISEQNIISLTKNVSYCSYQGKPRQNTLNSGANLPLNISDDDMQNYADSNQTRKFTASSYNSTKMMKYLHIGGWRFQEVKLKDETSVQNNSFQNKSDEFKSKPSKVDDASVKTPVNVSYDLEDKSQKSSDKKKETNQNVSTQTISHHKQTDLLEESDKKRRFTK